MLVFWVQVGENMLTQSQIAAKKYQLWLEETPKA
jgi:hypothetical protein